MMAHTICRTTGIFMILTLGCSCKPIKRSTNQQASECYGTECVVDLDFPTHTEVLFPENLTQAVMTALPSIVGTQDKIVNLLQNHTVNQIDTQDKIVDLLQNQTSVLGALLQTNQHLENMTATLTYLFENVANLLQEQLAIITPKNRDCADIAYQGHTNSTVYRITPDDYHGSSFPVYCDLETDGGGWTVFQHRFDGSQDFYLGWQDYANGFGDPSREYWAGLRLLRLLTQTGTWELLIELEDFNGNTAYAHYSSFQIGNAASNYRLSIGNYDGTAGDSLTDNSNYAFTTEDNDNDENSYNCGKIRKGGWWYSNCGYSNLNGLYLGHAGNAWNGMIWFRWKILRSLKNSSMKIRRID